MSAVGDWMIDVGSLLHEVESAAPAILGVLFEDAGIRLFFGGGELPAPPAALC